MFSVLFVSITSIPTVTRIELKLRSVSRSYSPRTRAITETRARVRHSPACAQLDASARVRLENGEFKQTLVRAPSRQRHITHATLNVKIAISTLDMETKMNQTSCGSRGFDVTFVVFKRHAKTPYGRVRARARESSTASQTDAHTDTRASTGRGRSKNKSRPSSH